MRRLLLAFALALPLAACIDADLTLDFKDAETVETAMDLRLAREVYDLAAGRGRFCAEGSVTVGPDAVTCTERRSMTVAELLDRAAAVPGGGGPEAALRRAARVERLDDNRLTVTLDFRQMAEAVPEAGQAQAMAGLMRAALAGHDLTFRIRAARIETTTGTLAPDGRSAEYILPLSAALGGTPPAPFVTTLRLTDCFLWVFC